MKISWELKTKTENYIFSEITFSKFLESTFYNSGYSDVNQSEILRKITPTGDDRNPYAIDGCSLVSFFNLRNRFGLDFQKKKFFSWKAQKIK